MIFIEINYQFLSFLPLEEFISLFQCSVFPIPIDTVLTFSDYTLPFTIKLKYFSIWKLHDV